MKNLLNQVSVIGQLLKRDFFVFGKKFFDDVINSMIMIGVVFIIFFYLGSFIGMKRAIAFDSMIGIMLSISFINRGFSEAIRDSFDFQYLHFVDYLKMLPLSTTGLLFAYVFRYMLRSLMTAAPLFVIVFSTLKMLAPAFTTSWIFLLVVYILGSFFWSSLLLIIASITSFSWFQFNIWQRILTPMLNLGCVFFPWQRVAHEFPWMGRALLINPMTYVAEGVRGALLHSDSYLDPFFCISVLTLCCCVTSLLLCTVIKRRFQAL